MFRATKCAKLAWQFLAACRKIISYAVFCFGTQSEASLALHLAHYVKDIERGAGLDIQGASKSTTFLFTFCGFAELERNPMFRQQLQVLLKRGSTPAYEDDNYNFLAHMHIEAKGAIESTQCTHLSVSIKPLLQ